jgi:hypothetical protein
VAAIKIRLDYPAAFFACALTFAHRFFAALAIAARPAADSTRFFTLFSSLFVESPKALPLIASHSTDAVAWPSSSLLFSVRV